jgi:hypothetical protein
MIDVKVYIFWAAIGLIVGWSFGKYEHKIERNLVRKPLIIHQKAMQ